MDADFARELLPCFRAFVLGSRIRHIPLSAHEFREDLTKVRMRSRVRQLTAAALPAGRAVRPGLFAEKRLRKREAEFVESRAGRSVEEDCIGHPVPHGIQGFCGLLEP